MLPLKPLSLATLVLMAFTVLPTTKTDQTPVQAVLKKPAPKIQVAVLLDVSNSMDGLIAQAKAQLWNMVSVMGKAKCDEVTPSIEIALYEYGRSNNDAKEGYVKKITGFTNDLDKVSQNLFNLTTHGGEEYCGHVMYSSLTEMDWDTASSSYKVIFIAGNEDFLQGDVSFSKACAEARKKNVIVNTIYCGDKMDGIREHWNLGSECGLGSFTNINPDARVEEIPTPYDSTLFVLNDKLNRTYIGYGTYAVQGYMSQATADQQNYANSKSATAKRIAVKGQSQLYDNRSWDIVDAQRQDSNFVFKLKKEDLPDTLRNKTTKQLEEIVNAKNKERQAIQQEIANTSSKRDAFIVAEKNKPANTPAAATLETEIEKIIRQQAARYNMIIR